MELGGDDTAAAAASARPMLHTEGPDHDVESARPAIAPAATTATPGRLRVISQRINAVGTGAQGGRFAGITRQMSMLGQTATFYCQICLCECGLLHGSCHFWSSTLLFPYLT